MSITLSSSDAVDLSPLSVAVGAERRARQIVERLGGVWRGGAGMCRCPAHDDRNPSLSVRLGQRAILFHCFAGCATTDILTALRQVGLHDRVPLVMPTKAPACDFQQVARRLWRASTNMAGTPVEAYLIARGLGLASSKLRYNPRTMLGSGHARRAMPAMIAAVENELGLVAVQRTFLDLSDITRKPLRRPKRALGPMGGGAIRLAKPAAVLGLAEGIEDALSAMAWFGTPTWAVGGIERLAMIDLPAAVRHIIVYGDRGTAAARGLRRAHDHLVHGGRTIEVRIPQHHADWNEAWQAAKVLRSLGD